MRKCTFIFVFLIPYLGFSQKSKNQPTPFSSAKIPAKEFCFRNYQFTWDSTTLNDTLTVFWYQHLESLAKKFPGCGFFNPGEDIPAGNKYISNASRFNQHIISDYSFDADSLLFRVNEIDSYNLSLQYMPFYMKNVEVTNAEYREFVHYVRDSIARRKLAEMFPEKFLIIPKDFKGDDYSHVPLNWEVEFKYYDPELMPILESMYYPDHVKFYWRRQFDVSKFIYKFYEYDPEYYDGVPGMENEAGNMIPHSIAVYPDTTAWTNDFYFSVFDPLTRNYFWHEAFDNYPVVGITFEQATAFCIWKTEQLKKKMAGEKFPFEFEVVLPKEHEWEFVLRKMDLSVYKKNQGYFRGILEDDFQSVDLDWKPGILLTWDDLFEDNQNDTTIIGIRKQLNNDLSFIISDNHLSNYYTIGGNGPHSKGYSDDDLQKFTLNYPSMAYNVSEWMDENYTNYQTNWGFRAGIMLTDTNTNHQKTFLPELIAFSNYTNAIALSSQGQLIRGSNWFDKGMPEEMPFNFSYANRKEFRPSSTTHSTLGFRYVIRLKPKY